MPAPLGILTDTVKMASWLTKKPGSQETQAIPIFQFLNLSKSNNYSKGLHRYTLSCCFAL